MTAVIKSKEQLALFMCLSVKDQLQKNSAINYTSFLDIWNSLFLEVTFYTY